MKTVLLPLLVLACVFLSACGSKTVTPAESSSSEQSLISAINRERAAQGLKALLPEAKLTSIARKDAMRRATSGGGYQDHRLQTGYEQMLTLSGRAKEGEQFGEKLLGLWLKNPVYRGWLTGNYAAAGVGTAIGANGLQTGVLLLASYGGGEI